MLKREEMNAENKSLARVTKPPLLTDNAVNKKSLCKNVRRRAKFEAREGCLRSGWH